MATPRRTLGNVIVGTVACLFLAACTPAPDGLVGITINPAGELLGMVRTCHHQLTGVTLQPENHADGANTTDIAIAEWSFTVDVSTASASWPILGTASSGVETTKQANSLPEEPLSMFGWTRNGSTMANSVYFRVDDMARLQPGSILVGDGGTLNPQEFDRAACEATR